jgi:hypothetical protein
MMSLVKPISTVFVSIPFDGRFDGVFQTVSELASQQQLDAVRMDEASGLARLIPDEIRRLIRDARLVVADVTGSNPNVLHEVGLAQAYGKPLVLLTQETPDQAAFNVRSLTVLRYAPDRLRDLEGALRRALSEVTSPNEVLRAMLVPSTLGRPGDGAPFVVVASPLSYRRARGRTGGYAVLRRTSSDYVGIRGILQGFGLLFDFDVLPEMLDPEDCKDEVIRERMNMYCIASPKANRWTGVLLEEYSRRWAPTLAFRPDPESPDVRNVRLSILCDGAALRPIGWPIEAMRDRYERDFGLIIRGPNPYDSELMTAIIAGRSSLGTEAACLAFTDPGVVETIQDRLSSLRVVLEDHKMPFWVLVSMKRAIGDSKEEGIRESLKVERVDAFSRK